MSNNRTIPNDILLKEVCDLLLQGKRVKLRPKGSSMSPCIRDGEDIVILAPTLTLRLGNIVLARIEDSRYVLHRIVGFKNDEIILMGDANLKEKERCRAEDVYGIAVGLLRSDRLIDLTSRASLLKGILRHETLPLRRFLGRIASTLNPHQKK